MAPSRIAAISRNRQVHRKAGTRIGVVFSMKNQELPTWIEQRIAELERGIATYKAEMQRRVAAGTGPGSEPQVLAKMQMWEKELHGLKSLREIEGNSEPV
jgi:hypothetical protein